MALGYFSMSCHPDWPPSLPSSDKLEAKEERPSISEDAGLRQCHFLLSGSTMPRFSLQRLCGNESTRPQSIRASKMEEFAKLGARKVGPPAAL